ncbi:MAG TPA: IclR family transcriptional regulator C-terminal domain-containing protein, partial [Microthrixaceae bacterium]|nr:IclR family transcriptional regulator C-terminal domain-containing protein [Microthrixaceae bacterium]
DDRDVLILATAESSQPLRFDRATGSRTPVHASAIGKAILAFAPRDRWRGPSTTLPAFTERTIVAGVDLEGQLEQIRSDGVALNLEERYVGVCAVAAPVLDAAGVARAGVGFQVPLARFGADRQRELSERAVTLAAELAEALPLDRL